MTLDVVNVDGYAHDEKILMTQPIDTYGKSEQDALLESTVALSEDTGGANLRVYMDLQVRNSPIPF
jgi:hypothetical protein